MRTIDKHYIGGEWVAASGDVIDVINPATEEACAKLTLGTPADLNKAVAAAKAASDSFAKTSKEERLDLLNKIISGYQARMGDIASVISEEMGAPAKLANAAQSPAGIGHFMTTAAALKDFDMDEPNGASHLHYEPVGVVGMITPWNWPVNQITAKVAPALAAGCTMVLKPSEITPGNAQIIAEIMDEAGVPPGVFNLVQGDGVGVGSAMSSHPDIDMMSFTGSTRAGVLIAKAAADTVKRVHQELGGKSPNIIMEGVDLQKAITSGVIGVVGNTGQSCNAPTRMLVPEAQHDEALAIAAAVASAVEVDDPTKEGNHIGPVVSEAQYNKIQGLIQKGIDEGATLAAGGTGRPEGKDKGYYVQPTIFGNVRNDMTIAAEEIFGPVLSIIPYKNEAEAIEIANDTPYGLAAYLWAPDQEGANRVAGQLRAGNVHVNGAGVDPNTPFGGYKQSGNGREFGRFGLEEFMEVKGVIGTVA